MADRVPLNAALRSETKLRQPETGGSNRYPHLVAREAPRSDRLGCAVCTDSFSNLIFDITEGLGYTEAVQYDGDRV